ncbi:hypothetical protein BY996DRAFT_4654684 [Phakopsora pachyrhizi]|nr:hypothetical protein BY996DRAFT_4654684 [Phakopsora pachyrhizi]
MISTNNNQQEQIPSTTTDRTSTSQRLTFPSLSTSSTTTTSSTAAPRSDQTRNSDECPSSNRPPRLRSALKLNSFSSFSPINPGKTSAISATDNGRPEACRYATSPLLPPTSAGPHQNSKNSPMSARSTLSRVLSSGELLPPGYERKVGFLTMEAEEPIKGGGAGSEYSFTLQAKSSNFKPRRDSRCFLVATDGEYYSIEALDWLMTSLVEHGDEVVVLQVVQAGGSAYKTLVIENEEHTKNEAQEVLLHVLNKNDRQITVTVEFVIGHVIKTIQRMIELYRPDSLVVGTRGKTPSAWQKAFSLNSTSQYLVARSPVPVIVVRPERKVRESKEARAKQPKRHSYQALVAPQAFK